MNFNVKVRWLVVFSVIVFIFIFFRIIYIDFLAPYRTKLAYAKSEEQTFERGPIMDRNGDPLAVSIRQTSVAMDPVRIQRTRLNEYIPLCNLLGLDFQEFKNMLKKDTRFVWLKRKVDDSTAERIRRLNLDGIWFVPEFNRFYPNKNLASHVIGCVGIDNEGLEGIELQFNDDLKGSFEDESFQRPQRKYDRFSKTIEGRKIILTIDKTIQHSVEKALKKVYSSVKPESVSAIVMDPKTGEILSMANLPDFDPNNVKLYSSRSLKNLCVTSFYEPGSIFKIIAMAAFLRYDRFSLKETYECNGSIRIGNKSIKCWKKHGLMVNEDILKNSCNIGMIRIALRHSAEELYTVFRDFGFGSLTGIELPGEVRGILRLPHQWGKFSVGAMSIGQEIGVTPVQLITACAAVANGGYLLQPHIIKEIRYANDLVFKNYSPLIIRRVISSNISSVITKLLVKVTEKGGTGEKASLPRYEIAGKTGTAQIFDNTRGVYYKDAHVLSFLGYYPVEDPQIIILVIIRKPKGKTTDLTGGLVAAPVFKDIAVDINGYLNIIPRKNIVNAKTTVTNLPSLNKKYQFDSMPDFTGYNMKQCAIILENMGLKGNFLGSGIAWKQKPEPGSKIIKSAPVTIWFKEIEP